jgi:hypothetical protein
MFGFSDYRHRSVDFQKIFGQCVVVGVAKKTVNRENEESAAHIMMVSPIRHCPDSWITNRRLLRRLEISFSQGVHGQRSLERIPI